MSNGLEVDGNFSHRVKGSGRSTVKFYNVEKGIGINDEIFKLSERSRD